MVSFKKIFSLLLLYLAINTSVFAEKPAFIVPIINYILMDTEHNYIKTFDGTWEGWGHQNNGLEWTIKIKIDSNNKRYLIDYPSLNCGGTLTLISSTQDKVEFFEKITYGRCYDEGITSLHKTSENKADFYWSKEGTSNTAFGELERN